jgi:adenine-specific DNA-methyltransferase
MPPRKPKTPTPVEALKHKDTRVNIPTEELREFVKDEEEAPRKMLYPRDPSLDPQLVWKGKDEQDSKDLEVPVVPIYIQEKIHPQALIENLRETAKEGEPEPELRLFDDFNGIKDFRQKIDFYSHDMGSQPKWSNRMILGDSLLVMTSLAEKEGLKGKVQMIYMDPPYGIKFGSNWQVSTRKRDVKDGKVEDATRQPEQVKAFRDTWQLGIHSYLTYLRDRLWAARELLTETGSIFVQIGDENVHLVRSIMDEVLGADNFCSQISFRKTAAVSSPMARVNVLAGVSDHLLWYAKNREVVKYRQLYLVRGSTLEAGGTYSWLQDQKGGRRRLNQDELSGRVRLAGGDRLFTLDNATSTGYSETLSQPVRLNGRDYQVGGDKHWKTTALGMARLSRAGRLATAANSLRYVRFFEDFPVYPVVNFWPDTGTGSCTEDKVYIVQTGVKVAERCVLMTTDPGDLVLDPTCGSGTSAYAAEQWGRRWVTIDTSRVALALARTRLMSAKYPYYILADSVEGWRKEAEATGVTTPLTSTGKTEGDVKKGFVYKRVPHITLKSIASNEEIDAINGKFQDALVSLISRLSRLTNRKWEQWEIPSEPSEKWSAEAKLAHEDWLKHRQARQADIDAAIARRADVEMLFDQPYDDSKRLRVAGPFTVESLSPHRIVSEDEERPASEARATQGESAGQFTTTILDNLRKAGVQNTKREERLVFDRLEPFAGAWIQAAGEYTDATGSTRRVAVSIGPEHGTVGPHQIQEAAKEAVRGISFDLLLVLGFSFDAHASEIAKEISPEDLKIESGFVAEYKVEYGKLPVLLVRMNPDLSMGDELLKKTGTGNLFMVFGEPEVKIDHAADGKLVVEIFGLDVYDPTTGVVRSSSTDDIACWFIDTEYNDESFFVRHAYFTGADEPYEKLKRALRADIDEAAWQTLYSTRSRPFDPPKSGKIAVKVINHYGDEVLKVYTIH